jgi:Ca-activated chloride channel homolog
MRTTSVDENTLKDKVTKLGLDFSLTTQWTAFVAVTQKIVNEHPEQTEHGNVPLPMVKGTTAKAYGENPQQLTAAQPMMVAQNFSGGAAPEPSTMAGMVIIAMIGLWVGFRQRQHKVTGNV